jgi:hypothetical protein
MKKVFEIEWDEKLGSDFGKHVVDIAMCLNTSQTTVRELPSPDQNQPPTVPNKLDFPLNLIDTKVNDLINCVSWLTQQVEKLRKE